MCEFDGMVKYQRFVRPGESPSDTVVREKRREDLVRDQRLGVSRVIWYDVNGDRRPTTAHGLWRGLERSAKLYLHNRTIIPL